MRRRVDWHEVGLIRKAAQRLVPLRLKRRGLEMRLVLEGEANQVREKDLAPLKALAHVSEPCTISIEGRPS